VNTAAHSADCTVELKRLRLEVRGLVQGVGFRPQVLRVASRLDLAGWVRNHSAGVSIEVEGAAADRFQAELTASLPPLARIDSLRAMPVPVTGERGFAIAESCNSGAVGAIPADVAICDDCLRELFTPSDRRYRHPFIACCNCGPRYSMTRRLPYDRSHTAMADFPLCGSCSREYRDTQSRRLHAEPIGCHDCGPTLSHSPGAIAEALRGGGIVALKGIGGYHLLCDARNERAVQRLRERKQRPHKPLAVMALNAPSIAQDVQLDDGALALLQCRERPIVILAQRPDSSLPANLSPEIPTLGVMLPYTPLHYLLFSELLGNPQGQAWLQEAQQPLLVCTSANRSGEPMVSDRAAAEQELAGVADLLVHHNRQISNACDDSVLAATAARPVMLRRGRGYAPQPMALAGDQPELLAVGAHLKNTLCALRGEQAFFSSHVGDLETPGTHALQARTAEQMLRQLDLRPRAIACDLHPDFASTRLAEKLAGELALPLVRVQHHHAHIGAVLAGAGHRGPVLGLALDGHGMGSDGGGWGGELLRVAGAHCDREGHLSTLAMPGGDRAARESWRLAAAWLAAQGREDDAGKRWGHSPLLSPLLALAAGEQCPRSSSAGRYFDLAAALLGVCEVADFEARAAMQLEGLCDAPQFSKDLFLLRDGELNLDPLLHELAGCDDPGRGAALFHGVLIEALAAWAVEGASAAGLDTIALGGGCFANRWLASLLPARLERAGLRVLTGWDRVPPGDGGISLGQAWVAARALESGTDNGGVNPCA
jgi:hydrogenase maturation protein HypF